MNSRDETALVQAQHAKATLKEKLGHPHWLRGIGIAGESGNYCVKVNVDVMSDEVRAAVPPAVNGVRVMINAVGNIRAL
jgi:hypothetical protein